MGGGVHLRFPSKRGGGPGGDPTLGPLLKSLHPGPKKGGVRTPWTPPPGSAHANAYNGAILIDEMQVYYHTRNRSQRASWDRHLASITGTIRNVI